MRIEPLECIIVDAGEFKNTTFLIHVIVILKHQIYVFKRSPHVLFDFWNIAIKSYFFIFNFQLYALK